jgi:hypothetical protein
LRIACSFTTDGLHAYLVAVDFGIRQRHRLCEVDKVYGSDPNAERRYAPPVCLSSKEEIVCGSPDPGDISTSYIERQNLTMRMSMRRFTRLTNRHSKKIENHRHALALHYVHYNFARKQTALKGTPAMMADLADRIWTIEDIVRLLEASEKKGA